MCNGVADLEQQLTATQQLAVSDRRRLQEKADGLETELAGANQAAAKLERELSSARSQLKVKEDDYAADRASALRSRCAGLGFVDPGVGVCMLPGRKRRCPTCTWRSVYLGVAGGGGAGRWALPCANLAA